MNVILPDWHNMLCWFFWRVSRELCICVCFSTHTSWRILEYRNVMAPEMSLQIIYTLETEKKCHRTEFHLFLEISAMTSLAPHQEKLYIAFCNPKYLNLILTRERSCISLPCLSKYLVEVVLLLRLSSEYTTFFNRDKSQVSLLSNIKSHM